MCSWVSLFITNWTNNNSLNLQQYSLLKIFPAIDLSFFKKLTHFENVLLPTIDATYQSPASHLQCLDIQCSVKMRRIAVHVVFVDLFGCGSSFCATHKTKFLEAISWSVTWIFLLLIPWVVCFRPGLVIQCSSSSKETENIGLYFDQFCTRCCLDGPETRSFT